jgi:hypothetical protein
MDSATAEDAAGENHSGVVHSAPPKGKTILWAPILSLLLSLFVFAMFPCMCGYYDSNAIPLSACATGIACYGWVATNAKFPHRLLHIIAFILSSVLLAKIITDVLWFGHNAVWRESWWILRYRLFR